MRAFIPAVALALGSLACAARRRVRSRVRRGRADPAGIVTPTGIGMRRAPLCLPLILSPGRPLRTR